jgi:hypothetical protein
MVGVTICFLTEGDDGTGGGHFESDWQLKVEAAPMR